MPVFCSLPSTRCHESARCHTASAMWCVSGNANSTLLSGMSCKKLTLLHLFALCQMPCPEHDNTGVGSLIASL